MKKKEKVALRGTHDGESAYYKETGRGGEKRQDVIILVDVYNDKDEWVCDHIWVDKTEWVAKHDNEICDRIEVTGWVHEYTRKDSTTDLGLQRVASGRVLQRAREIVEEEGFGIEAGET